MRCLNNSEIPGFTAKQAALGSPEYSHRVAQPVMGAVDKLPKAYRDAVNEYGYVEVYLAWRRGMSPEQIKQRAEAGALRLS